MGDFKNTENKNIIREIWCKPLLKYISETLQKKLIYLGLPGIKALDIQSWIEYLDKIIAFDVGHYVKKTEDFDEEIAKNNLKILSGILSKYERQNKISSYSLFEGNIEETILKEIDRNSQEFKLQDIVTIYNLDFCNSLTAPLRIVELNGNTHKYYKTEVITKLLDLQKNLAINFGHSKFIMLLTVHSNFWKKEIKLFPNLLKYKDNIDRKKQINPSEKNICFLKGFVFNILKDNFINNNFIPEFLPPIYYRGTGNNYLMTFSIIGTFKICSSDITPFYQDMDLLLNTSVISPKGNGFTSKKISGLIEQEPIINPIKALTNTVSFNKYWNNE